MSSLVVSTLVQHSKTSAQASLALRDVYRHRYHHYHHHAVLSNNINGTWGTLVNDSAVVNGDVYYHDFSFELPDSSTDSTYEVNNLSLVTYICERNNFNILQAIKTELGN